MNIENDMQKFKKLGYEAISKDLKDIEEEIRVKQYFFKVLHIMNRLSNLIESNSFKDKKIKTLRLYQGFESYIGEVFSKIEILDTSGKIMNIYNKNFDYIPEYEQIYNLFSFENFILKNKLYNPEIKNKILDIDLHQNIKNQLKNYLLNDNLNKTYDYMEMLDKNPEKSNQEKTSKKKI